MRTRAFGRKIMLLLLLSATTLFASAKKERWSNALVGMAGTLNINSTMEVEDITKDVSGAVTSSRQAFVGIGMTELYWGAGLPVMPDSFIATIQFKVDYKKPNDAFNYSTIQTQVLSYNKNKPNDIRKLYTVGDATYLKVTVQNIVIQYGTYANTVPYLSLGAFMEIDRLYPMDCSSTSLIPNLQNGTVVPTGEADEVTVWWDKVLAADEYDLEWAWVDQPSLDSGIYNPSTAPGLEKIFKNNASRVTLDTEQYKIPLLYDDYGKLFYRVRPVRYEKLATSTEPLREPGAWRQGNTQNAGWLAFNGHQRPLNWQASTSFAEGGKRKSVVQYFDGSLKGRQTVTKDNTSGKTVVAETMYDRQGRPAIQVLPAPTMESILKYTTRFNTLNGAEYDKNSYDSTATFEQYCSAGAAAMYAGTATAGSGAANYYSSFNRDISLPFNKYIPDAAGFPFTETRYTADNTGRIAAQGGVGPVHQLGTGRETKYYYSTPSQEQLDALFGTEVGYNNFYQKTMVRDANGQYSVSYTDMSGKTVATALAGEPPVNNLPDTIPTQDRLPNFDSRTLTEGLITTTNTYIQGRSIISNSSLLVTKPSYHTFNYSMTGGPELLRDTACSSPTKFICLDCLYDLTITISNDCNNKGLPGDTAMVVRKSNVPVGFPDTLCASSPPSLDNTFGVTLPEGAVNIVKTLTVSDSSMQKYREVYMRNNTCRTQQDFISQWTDSIRAGTPCQITDTATYNDLDNIRQLMLSDLTPPSGQFAMDTTFNHRYDPSYDPANPSVASPRFSIFYPYWGQLEPYRRATYTDESGQVLNNTENDPTNMAREDYIDQFQPSWAESMLRFHPEYNRLVKFEGYRPSHIWNETFENTATYAAASAAGYLSPLASLDNSYPVALRGTVVQDPFFITQATPYFGEPGLLPAFKDSLRLYVSVPNGSGSLTTINLWQYVNYSIVCLKPGVTLTSALFTQATSPANVFSPGYLCDGDLQMAWTMFRTLYLQKKKEFVNVRIQAEPLTAPAYSLAAPAVSHFLTVADAKAMLGASGLETDAALTARTTADLATQGANTCKGYAEYWWGLLAPCNIPQADSAVLINKMIDVCKNGYDDTHPYGASTVNPQGTYPPGTPASFVAIIEAWATANNRTAATCNAYLIDAPKPYSTPAVVTDKVIIEKPDSCGCARLSTLSAEIVSKGFAGNLSSYLSQSYNTVMAQGLLDTLIGKCNGTLSPTCRFFSSPISLPPVLQCTPVPVCQNCDRIKVLRDTFVAKYTAAPVRGAPLDSAQQARQRLFASFMNYSTGFSYGSNDYLDFIDTCDKYAAAAAWPQKHAYQSSGCDTARWVGSIGNSGVERRPQLNQLMTGGNFLLPSAITGTGFQYLGIDYYSDTMCFAPQTFEARVMMPMTGPKGLYNNYSFELQINYMSGTKTPSINFPVVLGVGGTSSCNWGKKNDATCTGSGGPYATSFNFEQWRVIKVVTDAVSHKFYIDNTLIYEVAHCPYDKIYNFYFAAWAASFKCDWIKLTDQYGNVVMNESFDNCATMSQISLNPCYSGGAAPTLCGITSPPTFTPAKDSACADVVQLGLEKGTLAWQRYRDSVSNDFDRLYLGKCMAAASRESLTVSHPVSEYHYTLYYYDRAGNLVKTVPPAGVSANYNTGYLASVKAERGGNTGVAVIPSHTLATQYRYNSLNQVVAQKTPDADRSDFWYDRLGRLALSRNARQASSTPDKYSYTVYDELGRITEVGQKQNATVPLANFARNRVNLYNFIYSATYPNTEATITVYDRLPDYNMAAAPATFKDRQKNYLVRNRVSYTQLYDSYTGTAPSPTAYSVATYYNYDIHGNVRQLMHDYRTGPLATTAYSTNQFKFIEYSYDLISGKVNSVAYNPGFGDQFYHRYIYDAENRLTDVYTTTNPLFAGNDLLEDHEVKYDYYRHGPLARMLLGQQQVQGVDYAYTLQGWLKGVNSTALNPTYDMGADGATPGVARDAIAFSLNYYNTTLAKDYKAIKEAGTTNLPFVTVTPTTLQTPSGDTRKSGVNLFNGNISSMLVNIGQLADPLTYAYRYDQLNRLTRMDAYRGFNNANNSFTSSTLAPLDDLKERITYDPNGNILSYIRNGNTAGSKPLTMDNLTYSYTAGTNKLDHVDDVVSPGNYTVDIDDQANANYTYDQVGNLTKDVSEGITNIDWTVYGKIKTISKSVSGVNTVINYTYDPSGYRISKAVTVTPVSGTPVVTTTTHYVRDAQGNTMAVYQNVSNVTNSLVLQEQDVYGSSRLGIYTPNLNVSSLTANAYPKMRGSTYYELSNHLGNVLATVSDIKSPFVSGGAIQYYTANVVSASDYAPFGMGMVGRNYSSDKYRYGFNGQEKSDDIKGSGNSYTAEFWEYDARLGRRWNIDPEYKKYPNESPYLVFHNNPILFIDPKGDDPLTGNSKGDRSLKKYERRFNKLLKSMSANDAANKMQADYGNKSWMWVRHTPKANESETGKSHESYFNVGDLFRNYNSDKFDNSSTSTTVPVSVNLTLNGDPSIASINGKASWIFNFNLPGNGNVTFSVGGSINQIDYGIYQGNGPILNDATLNAATQVGPTTSVPPGPGTTTLPTVAVNANSGRNLALIGAYNTDVGDGRRNGTLGIGVSGVGATILLTPNPVNALRIQSYSVFGQMGSERVGNQSPWRLSIETIKALNFSRDHAIGGK